MLKFGDIFRYKERDWVYLIHTEEILYSALILDTQMSEYTKKMYENLCKQKSSLEISKLLGRRAYCFVELRTEDVKGRIAHFGQVDGNTTNECFSLSSIGQLNNEDLREIQKEIEIGPFSKILKERVKTIVIES